MSGIIEAVASPATEAVSHDTVVKKSEYEQIGVKELYILDGFQKETAA